MRRQRLTRRGHPDHERACEAAAKIALSGRVKDYPADAMTIALRLAELEQRIAALEGRRPRGGGSG